MFKGTIEKRVLAVIKKRIAEAEKSYQAGVKSIEESFKIAITQAEVSRDVAKGTLADTLVTSVFEVKN